MQDTRKIGREDSLKQGKNKRMQEIRKNISQEEG